MKAFSAVLEKDLRDLSGDLHFGAAFYEGLRERSGADELPSRAKRVISSRSATSVT
ncbi:hypothetical protein [Janthinobacterium sp.]|uniref:hypothetical protein n=1 Tax=Janthinobacterium sp. TaxID=1871054 RepID=UPI002628EC71|nr:hypothetical protein [Janthinobacterium sp.]